MTTTGLSCGSCGTELNEKAKFCSDCGAAVSTGTKLADTRAGHRPVADVVHSMEIAAAVGAERLREIMAELVDRCAAVVLRYGGTVDRVHRRRDHGGVRRAGGVGGRRRRACLAALGVQEHAKRQLQSTSRSATVWTSSRGWDLTPVR